MADFTYCWRLTRPNGEINMGETTVPYADIPWHHHRFAKNLDDIIADWNYQGQLIFKGPSRFLWEYEKGKLDHSTFVKNSRLCNQIKSAKLLPTSAPSWSFSD